MKELSEKLVGVEPLDLLELLQRRGDSLPELLCLKERYLGDISLLTLAQRTMDALREDPPPEPTGPAWSKPWWPSAPAAYAAALLGHVGLASLASDHQRSRHALPPHARESAKTARDMLRRLGVPFAVREHAVALILNCRKSDSLAGASPPAETFLRMACQLDLRCLHRLAGAELRARGASESSEAQHRLDAFRKRADELGVFGSPPEPPLTAHEMAALGFGSARELHRAANALRYFGLRAGLADAHWARERLRVESAQARSRLNLLIGPAGSGKSTWAAHHLRHTVIVSSDLMRQELTGDPADQSQNYLVFQRCRDKVRSLLREGAAVTFDATNYMEDLREPVVQAARWSAAEIHSYFVDTSLEAALKRNLSRARLVPEQVIQRHYRLLTPPALYEADQQWVVEEDGVARLYWPADAPSHSMADA